MEPIRALALFDVWIYVRVRKRQLFDVHFETALGIFHRPSRQRQQLTCFASGGVKEIGELYDLANLTLNSPEDSVERKNFKILQSRAQVRNRVTQGRILFDSEAVSVLVGFVSSRFCSEMV